MSQVMVLVPSTLCGAGVASIGARYEGRPLFYYGFYFYFAAEREALDLT